VMFRSTNDGRSFGAAVKVGTISDVAAGTVAGRDIVVASSSASAVQVQAFPRHPGGAVTQAATPSRKGYEDPSLTSYRGGVLVASDDVNNSYVSYAKSGSNFNATSSYVSAGTFDHEVVEAVSGNALLTAPARFTGADLLRFFNGTSFSKPYKVPGTYQGYEGVFAMRKVGKVVHVFFEGRHRHFDLFSETTTDGKHWTEPRRYGSALSRIQLAPVLGRSGAGLVVETSVQGTAATLAQPILNAQRVHIRLMRSRVPPGHSTILLGRVSPHLRHWLVMLQYRSGKRWYMVQTTRESSSGRFSFTVPGTTQTYRAVVAYVPGYWKYGYSGSVTLTAT
jgi:hypothetical protein